MTNKKKQLQNSSKSPSEYLNNTTLILLRLLIGVILLAFLGGIIKTFLDLQLFISLDVGAAFRKIFLDTLTLLAVIEVLKTANGYLTDGRVRVTFVVDTVLIVMLNEVMSLWFRGATLSTVTPLLLIILTLIIVRVIAVRWPPEEE